MRGVLYRTDEDGNPLATPELKVSAINGSNIKVYANQEAKNAALENGDIKPGDVVLSGGTGKDAPIMLDWDNKVVTTQTVQDKTYTMTGYGYIFVQLTSQSYSGAYNITAYLNDTMITRCIRQPDPYASDGFAQVPVSPGDTLRIISNPSGFIGNGNASYVFVPYKEI